MKKTKKPRGAGPLSLFLCPCRSTEGLNPLPLPVRLPNSRATATSFLCFYLALPLVIFFAFPAAPLPFLRFAPLSLGPSTASYAARDSLALREVPSLSALFDLPIITCRAVSSTFRRGDGGPGGVLNVLNVNVSHTWGWSC